MPEEEAREGAIHLLDRELPADYRREWTVRLAAPTVVSEATWASVIVFRIGKEWLALPVTIFQEMAEPTVIHALPHRRGHLLGLVNVRGELLLCVTLTKVLGVEAGASTEEGLTKKPRLLVLDNMGSRLACPVDEVFGAVRYDLRELLETPATLSQTAKSFTRALLPWNGQHVSVIDQDALFDTLNRSFS